MSLLALGNDRLFSDDFLHELINVSSEWLQEVLCAQIQQIDGLGFLLTIAPDVLKQDAGWVVPQKEPFQFHLNIDYNTVGTQAVIRVIPLTGLAVPFRSATSVAEVTHRAYYRRLQSRSSVISGAASPSCCCVATAGQIDGHTLS